MKESNFFVETGKIIIIALLIVLPIRLFLFQPFVIRGSSMEPSFYESDYLLIDQISYRFNDPERGDVVIFQYPNDPRRRYIKRIIGLPGESVLIKEEGVYVADSEGERQIEEDYIFLPGNYEEMEIHLSEGEYFVLGDNRNASSDSRNWGPLPEKNIMGRVFFQISPANSVFAWVETPIY